MKYDLARELLRLEEETFIHQRRLQLLKRLTRLLEAVDEDEDGTVEQYITELQSEYSDVATRDCVITGLENLKSLGR